MITPHEEAQVASRSERGNSQKKVKSGSKSDKSSSEQLRNASLMQSMLGAGGPGRNVQGVIIEDLKVGAGPTATNGKRVKVHYVGKLKTTGRVFDSSVKKPFAFRLGAGEVIRGWDIGCNGMGVGGKRKLTIPPEKAYGKSGSPPVIPPNSTLVFEVTLLEVR